jgi:hypothetical protein
MMFQLRVSHSFAPASFTMRVPKGGRPVRASQRCEPMRRWRDPLQLFSAAALSALCDNAAGADK